MMTTLPTANEEYVRDQSLIISVYLALSSEIKNISEYQWHFSRGRILKNPFLKTKYHEWKQ